MGLSGGSVRGLSRRLIKVSAGPHSILEAQGKNLLPASMLFTSLAETCFSKKPHCPLYLGDPFGGSFLSTVKLEFKSNISSGPHHVIAMQDD